MRFFHVITVSGLLVLSSAIAETSTPPPPAPSLAAHSYLLEDFDSGVVLAEKDADAQVEPASITKVMTAYVVFKELAAGTLKLEDQAHVSEKAWRMEGSRMFVEVNTKVAIESLLRGMIVQSGNDASVALAEHIAGTERAFAGMMNTTAKALGMTRTHFVNATGLPAKGHHTTARDISTLTRALIRNFPEYYRWFSEKQYEYNDIKQHNRNPLLWRDPAVDGVKTGHTDSAGYCLVSSAMRNKMRLIGVVMGAKTEKSRADQSQSLLNYGFRFFETHRLYAANEELAKVDVYKGNLDQASLGVADDIYVTIPRGQYDQLKAVTQINEPIVAPLAELAELGTLTISLRNETLIDKPLITLDAVAQAGFWKRSKDGVRLWIDNLRKRH